MIERNGQERPSPEIEMPEFTQSDQPAYCFVILWHWRKDPGGGIADWFPDEEEAQHALWILREHGDPSKEFTLEAL